jgi:hypothetical protein
MPWAKSRPSADRRGYGTQHRKARAAAAERHSPNDPCTRCGHPLGPMSKSLHYDHSADRSRYLGFAHGAPCPWCRRRCNQVAGAKAGRARQNVIRMRL